MDLRSIPGIGEGVLRRLEAAGYTSDTLGRVRPSELVKRAGLRADQARRIVAAVGRFPVQGTNGEAPAPAPSGEGGSRSWERAWDVSRRRSSNRRWKWQGRVFLRVSVLNPSSEENSAEEAAPPE